MLRNGQPPPGAPGGGGATTGAGPGRACPALSHRACPPRPGAAGPAVIGASSGGRLQRWRPGTSAKSNHRGARRRNELPQGTPRWKQLERLRRELGFPQVAWPGPLTGEGPRTDTGFKVQPHQCPAQGDSHCPGPAATLVLSQARMPLAFLATLPARIQLAVNQHLQGKRWLADQNAEKGEVKTRKLVVHEFCKPGEYHEQSWSEPLGAPPGNTVISWISSASLMRA
ncbi:uncharacterized protein LOC115614528 [Strigops habroptila]|uniref:uncharacterized protein LOC115614528 n=1 Tax=Strigops habroptila TaxID=2489341 RepID=UPI0011CFA210|nr:uncharacterized protein LOC115614528 [Strigops habroptila]